MEREMKEMELEGDKSKKQNIGTSLTLQEVERALDDAGIYEGINQLAYTSPGLEKLGYSSLAEAWIHSNPFEKWAPSTYSWDRESGYIGSSTGDVEAGSKYYNRLDKFAGDMKKYGIARHLAQRFYEEVISDFEYSKHRYETKVSYKNEKCFEKWSEFLGRPKKDWGNSPFEQFIWGFLHKNPQILPV